MGVFDNYRRIRDERHTGVSNNSGVSSSVNAQNLYNRYARELEDDKEESAFERYQKAKELNQLEKKKTGEIAPEYVNEANDRLSNLSDEQNRLIAEYVNPTKQSVGDRNHKAVADTRSAAEKRMGISSVQKSKKNVSDSLKNTGLNDDDIKSYSEAYKTSKEFSDRVARGDNMLDPTEQVKYGQAKIDSLSKDERSILGKQMADEESYKYKSMEVYNYGDSLSDYVIPTDQWKEDLKKLDPNKWTDDKIDEYAKYIDQIANYNTTNKFNSDHYEINKNASTGEKVWQSIANTGHALNPINQMEGGLIGMLGGKDVYAPEKSMQGSWEYGVEQVANNAIGEDHPVVNYLYSNAVSTAQSYEKILAAAAVGDVVGATASALGATAETVAGITKFASQLVSLSTFGEQAYNSTYKDARERGISEEQSQKLGVLSGVIEAATELIPIDNLGRIFTRNKEGNINIIKDFLKQAGLEGLEEGESDILNRISDYVIVGKDGKNQMSLDIQAYEEQGMSHDDAVDQAERDFWKNTFLDVLGGAISGGVMASGEMIRGYKASGVNKDRSKAISKAYEQLGNYEGDSNYAKSIRDIAEKYKNNPTQYLADIVIDDSTEQGKEAKAKLQEYADKEAEGKRLTASDRLNIERSIYLAEEASKESKSNARAAYAQYQRELSFVPDEYRAPVSNISVEDARKNMIEAAKSGDAQKLSDTYQAMKNSTSADMRSRADDIFDEFKGMAELNGISSEEYEGIKTTAQDAYLQGLRGNEVSNSINTVAREAYNKGAQERIEIGSYSVQNKADLTNKVNTANGTINVKSIKNGLIETTDGKSINVENITDPTIKSFYKAAALSDKGDIYSNAFLENYTENVNIENYRSAFNDFFNEGRSGASFDAVMKGSVAQVRASRLGNDVVKAMYDAGAKQRAVDSIAKAIRNNLNYRSQGRVVYEKGINKSLFAESIASVSGLEVRVVNDFVDKKMFADNVVDFLKEKGKAFDEAKAREIINNGESLSDIADALDLDLATANHLNGARADYSAKEGTITLKTSDLASVFHELTHFGQNYAEEEYNILKQTVLDALATRSEVFAGEWEAYRKTYKGITSSDEISDEFVASAMVGFMSTKEGQEAFIKALDKNCTADQKKSILGKVKDFFKKLLDSLRNIVKTSNMSSYERAVMNSKIKDTQKIVDQWVAMFEKASATHRSMDKDGSGEIVIKQSREVNVDINGDSNLSHENSCTYEGEKYSKIEVKSEMYSIIRKNFMERFPMPIGRRIAHYSYDGVTYAAIVDGADQFLIFDKYDETSKEMEDFVDAYRNREDNSENNNSVDGSRGYNRSNVFVENGEVREENVRLLKRKSGSNRPRNNDIRTWTEEDEAWYQSLDISSEAVEISDINTKYSLRLEDPPKKTIKAYKVFVVFENAPGKLYPPMVASPNGAATPVGVWINADTGEIARDKDGNIIVNTKGRMQVQAGGKGTNKSKGGTLAWRPGWHLGQWPDAIQFVGKNDGLLPAHFVFAECEIAADVDYQNDAVAFGVNERGKFNRTQAGLPYIPKDGYYKYRTNPNPDTAPWYITGAMKVTRILTDEERRKICDDYGVEATPRKGGDIDLAKFGLRAGKVTPTKDLSYLPTPIDYSDEIKQLPGYKKGVINFDDPQVINEYKINNLDINDYRDRSYSLNIDDLMGEMTLEDLDESWIPSVDKIIKDLRANSKNLKLDAMGDEFVDNGKTIAFKDERIEKYLNMYAASNEDYAQAYVTYLSPKEFLYLTANGKNGERLERIKKGSKEFNEPEFVDAIDGQPIFLVLDENDGEIIGHEGRHRMYALAKSGVTNVPVLVFNYDNKYSKKRVGYIDVYTQSFSSGDSYSLLDRIALRDLEPLSRGNKDTIIEKFGSGKASDIRYSLAVDSSGEMLSQDQKEFFKDAKTVDSEGRLKRLYHGTSRADRVGNYFDPNRATSGPMAFFTDDPEIAANYSKTKADTSLSRDSEYDSYYTQFRMTVNGKDMSVSEAWNKLPTSKRTEIMRKAAHVTMDDDYENIIYNEKAKSGLGNFDQYLLKEHKNNYLEALTDAWLESGDLFGEEVRFLDVLRLVGLDEVEYKDPEYREEKVYEVYLNITNPLKTQELKMSFVREFEEWLKDVDQSKYESDDYASDAWDKTSMNIYTWIGTLMEDIRNNTTYSWTTIPDQVTDFLKEKGYDGIEDQGGKYSNMSHTVYIPFYSNQIKNVDNPHPTENPDIRYSLTVDSKGNELSEGQREYFKDSKAVDENGNLKVYYHGTSEGGFTVFDPSKSDDNLSLFFSDDSRVSMSYGNSLWAGRELKITNDQYKGTGKKEKFDDGESAAEFLKSLGFEISSYQTEAYGRTNTYWTMRNPLTNMVDYGMKGKEFRDFAAEVKRYGLKAEGLYSVYLNAVNPLVVDANGSNWNSIKWSYEGEPSDSPEYKNTRFLARYAYDHGYDSVIINNIVDYKKNVGTQRSSQIVIVFKGNQVKSKYNLNPTENEDIRYSLTVDSEGKELSEGQREFFKDSKMVNEDGSLKVMYHGSQAANITIFDPKYSDDQISLFFTDRPDVAKTYGDEQYKVYLNLVNPLIVEGYNGYWNRIPYGDVRDITANKTEVDGFIFNTADEAKAFDDKYHLTEIKQVYADAMENGEAEYNGAVYDEYEAEDLYLEAFYDAESEYRRYHQNNSVIKTIKDFFDNYQEYGWFDLHKVMLAYDHNAMSLSELKETGFTYEEAVQETLQMFKDEAEENGLSLDSILDDEVYILPHENEKVTLSDEKLTTRQIAKKALAEGYDGVIFKNISDTKVGLYAPSDVAIAFNSNQIKSVNNLNPTENNDYRYSINVDSWLDEMTFDEDAPEVANILTDGLQTLKTKKVNKEVVKKVATDIKSQYGSNIGIEKLTDMIEKAFRGIQSDVASYDDALRIFKEIATPVIEQSTTKVGGDLYTDFIQRLSGHKIKLNASQMAEVKQVFGSYDAFKKALPQFTFNTKEGTSLDSLWGEMVEQSGYVLEADEAVGSQPIALYDAVQAMKPTVVNNFGGDAEEVAKDCALRIIEDYLNESGDAKAKEAVNKVKATQNEFRSRVKQNYQARLQEAKKSLREKEVYTKKNADYNVVWKQAEAKKKADEKIAKIKEDYNQRLRDAKAKAKSDAEYQYKKQKLEADWREAELKAKQEARIAEINERNAQNIKDVRATEQWKLAELNTKRLDQIADIKARAKNDKKEQLRRQQVKHEREQIGRVAKKLMRWITNPTDKDHVPKKLQDAMIDMFNALDFVEPEVMKDAKGNYYITNYRQYVLENGHKKYGRFTGKTKEEVLTEYHNAQAITSNNAQAWADRMMALNDILSTANRAVNDSDISQDADLHNFLQLIDPDLAAEFDDLLRRNRGQVGINNLDVADLKTIKNTLRGIAHWISNANRMFTSDLNVDEVVQDTLATQGRNRLKDHTRIYNRIAKNLIVDMATPETAFELQGGKVKQLFDAFNKGFERKTRDIKQASEYMAELLKDIDPKEVKKWTGEKAKRIGFSLEDGDIELSIAHIMSLYELKSRPEALQHILVGGIETDPVTHGLFKTEHPQNKAVHVTMEEINRIVDSLTPEQKRVADGIQKFMANECSAWGNEASEMMYNYDKFLDPNYFPMQTDADTHATTNQNAFANLLNGIEHMGFTKALTPNADNALVITDIFDVMSKHVTQMAAYHSYAPVVKDTLRWLNYKARTDNTDGTQNTTSVKKAINSNFGRIDNAGVEYFEKFLKDINESEKSADIMPFWNNLIGNYKGAAVGANLRVVVQQPTAYVRAANMVNPKYLIKALPKIFISSKEMKRITEISPTAYWKSQGYYETNMGKSLKEIITGISTPRDQIIEKSMWLAGKADDITWACLYNAIEMEQRAQYKGQGLTDEEFTEKVNERFRDVIAQTQVVDATIQKSQWMRAKGVYSKLLTSFMAEPTKSYNMAVKSMLQDYRDHGNNVIKWKSARKAMIVLLLTDLLTSLAQSLMDGLRYSEDDDDYWDTMIEYFNSNLKDNVNPLNRIPGLKDVTELIKNAITGETNYGQSSGQLMDASAIESVMDMVGTSSKLIQGNYNKTGYAAYMTYAKGISNLTGIPVYNLSRDVASFWNLFADDEYRLRKKVEGKNDKYKKFYESLNEEESDAELIEAINKAMNKGGTVEDIKSGIGSKYKSQYMDAFAEDDEETMADLKNIMLRGYKAAGYTESDLDDLLASWTEEKVAYSLIDDAIESGEGIQEAIKALQDADKKDDNIIEHIMNAYQHSVEYERTEYLDSGIEDNVNEALRILNTDYDKAKKDLAEKAKKAAEEKAAKAKKNEAKSKAYEIIDSGSGDYKSAINEWVQAGAEASDIKSTMTSDYVKPYVKAYMEGDSNAQAILVRIATVKAYMDQQTGLKIAKKYRGDYYKYEMDQIYEMMDKYQKEPW